MTKYARLRYFAMMDAQIQIQISKKRQQHQVTQQKIHPGLQCRFSLLSAAFLLLNRGNAPGWSLRSLL